MSELVKDTHDKAADKFKYELDEANGENSILNEKLLRAISVSRISHVQSKSVAEQNYMKAVKNEHLSKLSKAQIPLEDKISGPIEQLQLQRAIHQRPLGYLEMGPIIEEQAGLADPKYPDWAKMNVQLSRDQRWKLNQRMGDVPRKLRNDSAILNEKLVDLHYRTIIGLTKFEDFDFKLRSLTQKTAQQELQALAASHPKQILGGCRQHTWKHNIQCDHLASHVLLDHKPVRSQNYTYKQLANNEELDAMLSGLEGNPQYDIKDPPARGTQQLEAEKIIRINYNYFMLLSNNSARIIIRFSKQASQTKRVCTIEDIWKPKIFQLVLAIALAYQEAGLQLQRVPEMALQVDKRLASYFEREGLLKTLEVDALQLLCEFGKQNAHLIPMCKKGDIYLEDAVPCSIPPQSLVQSQRGNVLRKFVQALGKHEFPDILDRNIKLQSVSDEKVKNAIAVQRDQAVPPKEIFAIIYQTILIRKEQMLDVCKFQPDWNDVHYFNALKFDWVDNFIYCNPPFSIGAWPITDMILQYFKRKNIVAMLPQRSAECQFAQNILRLIGGVYSLGQIPFKSFNSNLPTPVSQFFQPQPDQIDFK